MCTIKLLDKNLHRIFVEDFINNNNYRPENLKAKIEHCSKYKNLENLNQVLSTMPAEKLIRESFQLGTNKQLKKIGQIIKT